MPIRSAVVAEYNNGNPSYPTFVPTNPPSTLARPVSYPQISGSAHTYNNQQVQRMMPNDDGHRVRSVSAPDIAHVSPGFQYNVRDTTPYPDPMLPGPAFDFHTSLPDTFHALDPCQYPLQIAQDSSTVLDTSAWNDKQPLYPLVASSSSNSNTYPSDGMSGMNPNPSLFDPNTGFVQQYINPQNSQHNGHHTWPKSRGTNPYVNGQNQFQAGNAPTNGKAGHPGNMNWDHMGSSGR